MAETIYDADGNEVEVFIRVTGGMVDAIIRADTEADWVQGAVFYGLLVEADGDLRPAAGVEIDALGAVLISPGEVDESGKVIVQPVFDTRYHLNLRIHGPALERTVEGTDFQKWKAMAINWTRLGDEDAVKNADERAVVLHRVGLIDPATIRSQARVWL